MSRVYARPFILATMGIKFNNGSCYREEHISRLKRPLWVALTRDSLRIAHGPHSSQEHAIFFNQGSRGTFYLFTGDQAREEPISFKEKKQTEILKPDQIRIISSGDIIKINHRNTQVTVVHKDPKAYPLSLAVRAPDEEDGDHLPASFPDRNILATPLGIRIHNQRIRECSSMNMSSSINNLRTRELKASSQFQIAGIKYRLEISTEHDDLAFRLYLAKIWPHPTSLLLAETVPIETDKHYSLDIKGARLGIEPSHR